MVIILSTGNLLAHDLKFSQATMTLHADGRYRIEIVFDLLESGNLLRAVNGENLGSVVASKLPA